MIAELGHFALALALMLALVQSVAPLIGAAQARTGDPATSEALEGASEEESARWSLGETVTLRGHERPTRLASPV